MKPIDTVRKIYRDFAAGDAAAILAVFADDIEFRLAEGHPYRGSAGAWHGKQAIAESFFAVAGPEWDGWSIGVEQTLETANAVVVEGRYTGIYKSTGRRMDVQVCHVWRFAGAKVASFHQYVDTASLRHVMGRDTSPAP
jgi:ketosteroid isomerase-like protein